MQKSGKKARVKPFKPLGNRVSTGSLKPANYGNIATREQIAQIVRIHFENRGINA